MPSEPAAKRPLDAQSHRADADDVPPAPMDRLHRLGDKPIHADGDYVLYWMTAARRTTWNHGLQHAVHHAQRLSKPLVVLEGVRCDYPWASDRIHHTILAGMRDNQRHLRGTGFAYLPYVETTRGQGKGLIAALARQAALVVADVAPVLFIPRMLRAAATQLPVRLECVDSWGLLPLGPAHAFPTAQAFRRYAQANLVPRLVAVDDLPVADPVAAAGLRDAGDVRLPATWPDASPRLGDLANATHDLPIRHDVPPVASFTSGAEGAARRLASFVARLDSYEEDRDHPDRTATSSLSPDLHLGHVSAHEILAKVLAAEDWHPGKLAAKPTGKRVGWWGCSAAAEAFLDQLVTWRELGAMEAWHNPHYASYEGLPPWAKATLDRHAADARWPEYTLEELREARTHDPLWNAAQRSLRTDGLIHNYLRMLWGKKILEWSPDPPTALAWMLELNDTYALDGRDPNSVCGIMWVLGRYDHPWPPEREVYGTVRTMGSINTLRKVEAEATMAHYGEADGARRLKAADRGLPKPVGGAAPL